MHDEKTWHPKRRGHVHNILVKEWPNFYTDPKFKGDQNAVDTKRRAGGVGDVGVGDDLRIFLQDCEDCMLSSTVEEIEEFCRGAELDNVSSCATQRRAAWLDDTSFQHRDGSRCARTYKNPLTANALYELLNEPVNMRTTVLAVDFIANTKLAMQQERRTRCG